MIAEPELALYYDRLRSIVRDPIWSGVRWRNIFEMNLGRHDYLLHNAVPPGPIRALDYQDHSYHFRYERFQGNQALTRFIYPKIRIWLRSISHAPAFSVEITNNVEHAFVFMKYDQPVGMLIQTAASGNSPQADLMRLTFSVPREAVEAGYNNIHIRPVQKVDSYMRGFRLLNNAMAS